MNRIKDYSPTDKASLILRFSDVQIRKTTANQDYASLLGYDGKDFIETKIWSLSEEKKQILKSGEIYYANGTMKDYQGKMQFNVSDFRLATEEEMKESGVSKDDFYEYAKLDIDTLQEKIVSYIDKINNEILKSALHTSRALLQMLANMQEGMRGYFDELSKQRSFRGIQEVLVKEINNSDSKKYAILTTTDSFYRYKEAVKELIEENLEKTEARKYSFETELLSEEENTRKSYRLRRMIEICEEATDMLYKISREFDAIERRYNKLIEQKTVFASRAAARIRYIMMEGVMEEDQTVALINLINESGKSEEILEKLSSKLRFSEPYKIMTEKSLYQRRENQKEKFTPQAVTPEKSQEENMTEFVLEPLYTQKEIRDFRKKNEQNGKFTVTKNTVKSIEDLEKLFMVWQHATESADSKAQIEVAQEMENEAGFRFSKLTIEGVESDG